MQATADLLIALRRVIRATDLHSRQLARSTGLTTPQILLLQAVRDNNQITISEIAHDISLSQATVTTIIDRLEKRHLIYRQRSTEDKRKVHLHLTPAGHEALQGAPLPLQDQLAGKFVELQDWEQTMIIAALQRLARLMDAGDLDASPVLDLGKLDREEND